MDGSSNIQGISFRAETGLYGADTAKNLGPANDTHDVSGCGTLVRLSVRNLSYSLDVRVGNWWHGSQCKRKQTKRILKNVSVQLAGGKLAALLGNSGSGKTSLLDVLSFRLPRAAQIQGDLYLNDSPYKETTFRNVGSYVTQDDFLIGNLTVKETLVYTAKLKYPRMNEDDINLKVTAVLVETGLNHVAESRVGGTIQRGISGGEKRRLSIAISLLQDPYVLILDEPTSGLDSFTAHEIAKLLSALSHDHSRIVVMSVHQPRSDLYSLFDDVGVLSEGEIVYFGPRAEMIEHFSGAGYPCPTHANPLDTYVDVCSIDNRNASFESDCRSRMTYLVDFYNRSRLSQSHVYEQPESGSNSYSPELHWLTEADSSGDVTWKSKCSDYWSSVSTLYKRMNVCLFRDTGALVNRIILFLVMSFLFWIFLIHLAHDVSGIQDRSGLVFELVSVAPIFGMLNGIALFPPMRDVYYRERLTKMYSQSAFIIAYFIHIIPFNIISPVFFSFGFYWALGMYPDIVRCTVSYTVLVALQYLGELITVLMLSLLKQTQLAQGVTTLTFSLCILAGTGLLRTTSQMLKPIQWLQYITFFKYASEVLIVNEFHQLILTCNPNATCTEVSGDLYLTTFYPGAVDRLVLNGIIVLLFVFIAWFSVMCSFKFGSVKS